MPRTKTFYQTVHDKDDNEYSVQYYYDGYYYPGTPETPPEYPELVVEQIYDEHDNPVKLDSDTYKWLCKQVNENHDGASDD